MSNQMTLTVVTTLLNLVRRDYDQALRLIAVEKKAGRQDAAQVSRVCSLENIYVP